MPEQYYDSPLSGQQLDAAFQQMQGIEQTASRVQSNNWGNKGQDDTCAVPAFLYGMKF